MASCGRRTDRGRRRSIRYFDITDQSSYVVSRTGSGRRNRPVRRHIGDDRSPTRTPRLNSTDEATEILAVLVAAVSKFGCVGDPDIAHRSGQRERAGRQLYVADETTNRILTKDHHVRVVASDYDISKGTNVAGCHLYTANHSAHPGYDTGGSDISDGDVTDHTVDGISDQRPEPDPTKRCLVCERDIGEGQVADAGATGPSEETPLVLV